MRALRFDAFTLDQARRTLLRDGAEVDRRIIRLERSNIVAAATQTRVETPV